MPGAASGAVSMCMDMQATVWLQTLHSCMVMQIDTSRHHGNAGGTAAPARQAAVGDPRDEQHSLQQGYTELLLGKEPAGMNA